MRWMFIEACDFEIFPPGGQLSFARQVIPLFEGELALVGISTDDTPVGRWVERRIDGRVYPFFSIGRYDIRARKPLIPHRLRSAWELWHFRRPILSLGLDCALLQSPELLMVASRWKLGSCCYIFHGVENPLEMPRYAWGRPLAGLFERRLFQALTRTESILACADERAIAGLIKRRRGGLVRERIKTFPTRVDTAVFFPRERGSMRRHLNLPDTATIIVACGRINRVKGWDLILAGFQIFAEALVEARLVFVGDGEDRGLLEADIERRGLRGRVRVTGFQAPSVVAAYLNAADLAVVGSHREGWSIAMLEAMACGRNVVATDVSGARAMITEGVNGRIVTSRDARDFAAAMRAALELEDPNPSSLAVAEGLSLRHLRRDLARAWEVLQ